MKYSTPELTIIIPTRNRAQTLEHALRTCTSQSYERLNILVSDNASTDDTVDIVKSINDTRIRYLNTHQRMSMTRNWEFALSHVNSGYISFMGDDDGLLPNAASDIASIIQQTQTDAISWNKAEYHWPNHPNIALRDLLMVSVNNVLLEFSSDLALKHSTRFWLPYNKLPTLYNSFVSYDSVDACRKAGEPFFRSVTPDVYSGFALMQVLNSYLYSSRPFSVNGSSASSNGAAAISGSRLEGEAANFMSEIDFEQNEMYKVIPGAIYSSIVEALLQANKYCFGSQLKINHKLAIKLILRDIYRYLPDRREQSLKELFHMVEPYDLRDFAEKTSIKIAQAKIETKEKTNDCCVKSAIQSGNFVLNTKSLDVNNIYSACQLVGNLLPPYQLPESKNNYSFSTLVLTNRCTDFNFYAGWRVKLNTLRGMIRNYIGSNLIKIIFK